MNKKGDFNPTHTIGEAIDSLNHINVYYNGGVNNVQSRNTIDGYNIGLEYQCVEFVKRYYYKNYNHKMPDSYGHAFTFFDTNITDGKLNTQRNLLQFTNPSKSKPQEGDLIVSGATTFNSYGHVAIIASVINDEIEIIQQNAGPFSSTREKFQLTKESNHWMIENKRTLGWLRMK